MASQNYPGNSSLPAEVKQRVISTFKHAIDVYRQGNFEDARAGCDYILSMDPLFDPAKRLTEKIDNPAAFVDVDQLAAHVQGDDVIDQAREAFRSRDFARALELTSDILRNDLMNTEAQEIAQEAQAKLEAAPFIDQFIKSGRAKVEQGNSAGAASDLQKAKQLDPDHPLVRDLEARISGGAAPSFDVGGGGFASPFGSGFSSPDPFAAPAPAAPQTGFGTPDFGSGGFGAPAGGFGDPSSSFVVDSTPAATNSGAAASDFGFTFEEEQPPAAAADFSFGAPGIAPPSEASPFASGVSVGEANTFDFATASVETTDADRAQIARYLEEGDSAFSEGDYQRAIDTWSKVFLIDVTNDEASNRIEKARARRQEVDRKVEELVVAGTLAYEKRDFATAQAKFEEVLALDPNHFNAREYLDRIAEGGGTSEALSSGAGAPGADFFEDDYSGLSEAPIVPPEPGAAPAPKAKVSQTPTKTAAAAPAKAKRSMLPLLAIIGVLVLGGIGYFAWTRFAGGSAASTQSAQEIFARAEELAAAGKYDQAIALLAGVSADDPQHDKALEMISDLKKRKAQSAGMIQGRPSAEVFAEYVAKGRAAYEARDYLTSKQMFEQALAIQALPPDVRPMFEAATQQVAKLESAILMLREGRYDDGIANLESLLQQDPNNESVKVLLGKAHFNFGVAHLQQENIDQAIAEFDTVLRLTPADGEAKRSRDLAAKYNGKPKDLMYKIYVKYLPLRPV